MNRFVLITIAMLAWTAETMWRCHADSELREQQLAAMGDFNPPPATNPPARIDYYEAWLATRDMSSFIGDVKHVTITTAEYATLTNGMERLRKWIAASRARREAARKRREEAAAREAEAVRARGIQRVRDIRRLRDEAKKGGAK